MEPNVVRMYSSSPPPFDEEEDEEDEDDFGEFGGYCCGVSSSISFSDYDMPTAFDQSFETDPSPPDLYDTVTPNVAQPGKEIAKDQEAPIPELPECGTAVSVDSGNGKMETAEVLPNRPSSPDSEREVSVGSVTPTHGTSERQDFKLICKEDQQQPSSPLGQCVCNGPVMVCTDKEPSVTSDNSTESVVVSSTKDFTPEAVRKEHPIDSNQLLADQIPRTKVSEDAHTLAEEDITKSVEVDSRLAGESQSNQEQTEEKEDMASEDTCLTPVTEKTPSSHLPQGPMVVSGPVELGEDFEEVCLPVVDQVETELDAEANSVLKEVQRVVLGSSGESDEDFGVFRDATQGFPDVSQTESMSKEGFADFVTALSDCSSHDEFADAETLKDLKDEDDLPEENKDDENNDDDHNNVDTKIPEMPCSELPPSDSFADFSSAPFGDLAGTTSECWAAFGQQEACEEQQESWAAFEEEQQASTTTAPSTGSLQADNVLVGFSHKLQHLFERTFPLEKVPEDSAVPTLQVLLEPQDHAEIRESVAMWRHLLDIHNTHGLKVQWVGSHSNRILLDCLGIYNILFTGQNKQPVIVPMFAAGLGMLEPTKEPVKPSSIFSSSSPLRGRSTLCAQVASSLSLEDDGTSQRRASFSVNQRKPTRHSRQKSYS